MEILESITTTYMLKSANLSTCALTLKAKLNMETLVLVMLDEAPGPAPSLHPQGGSQSGSSSLSPGGPAKQTDHLAPPQRVSDSRSG